MSGPLSGFRVVDLTNVISGPMATQILGDQGADIVKVEARGGDLTRGGGNRQGGLSAAFLNNNRNKRSIVLDLKQPEGVALLKRLAATADVFIQNFRPGVVERLGVGEADIRAVRPDIVYVSISGFGEKGPFASKPTYDPIVQAISGLTTVQAGSDEARPRLVRTILPDKVTALTAAQAVTSALLHRAATGEGQHVRVSMLDSVVAFLWNSDMGSQTFVDAPVSIQRAASFIDLIYETADGFMSVSLMTDRQWLGFCEVAGRDDLAADPRFATGALRDENIDARLEQVQEELRKRTTAEWTALFDAANVPSAPVLNRRQMVEHPQLAANGTLVEYDHPLAGRLRQARPAIRFEGSPSGIRRGGSELGADTREVLAEAGVAEDEIDAAIARGAAGVS
ncbi:MAG: CoA transferase [Alphaproteobacteria bacterium]|nr:CoA transferase [Alphaproteobacteria bacterium]